MSYNVDRWKTAQLVDLRVPVKSLFTFDRTDWHPKKHVHDDGSVSFEVILGSFVRGTIERVDDCEWLRVTNIEASGEGSGAALHYIFEPALKDSRGKLVATRVWESGDCIDRLTVIDGVLSSESIDI